MTDPNLPAADWSAILSQGFGAQTTPLVGSASVSVFSKYLLRAGYINFPFGIRNADEHAQIIHPDTIEIIRHMGIDLLRLNWPQHFGGYANVSGVLLPEVSIFRLDTWSEQQLDSDVRYKIRRSRREGITVRLATVDDAEFIYNTYLETIHRHGGKRRYTQAYFRALCEASTQQPMLLVLLAETRHGEPCGFHISAYRQGTAYYLHGGMCEQYAQYRPGYALMCEAIRSARDTGCHAFNFMPSPPNQPALVKFKRKWGGEMYEVKHIDTPLSTKGRCLHAVLHVSR